MTYIILTIPKYDSADGSTSDEKFYVKADEISEILPYSIAARRGDGDDWKSEVVMRNGNKYHVLEDPNRIIELISDIVLG
jgi:hypothetical protein